MAEQAVRNFLELLSSDDEKLEPLRKEVELADNFEAIVLLARKLDTEDNEWLLKDGISLKLSDFIFTAEDLKNVLKELVKNKNEYDKVLDTHTLNFQKLREGMESLKYFSPKLLEGLKIEIKNDG